MVCEGVGPKERVWIRFEVCHSVGAAVTGYLWVTDFSWLKEEFR